MATTQTRPAATHVSTQRILAVGTVAGMVGGVVFGALNMWFAASTGKPFDTPLKMIATIVQGASALPGGTANPVLGLVVHMMLSAGFGVVLALAVSRLGSVTARASAGLVFGAGLYVVNFLVISPIAFHVFRNANQPLELATHLVFGTVAVLPLLGLNRTTR